MFKDLDIISRTENVTILIEVMVLNEIVWFGITETKYENITIIPPT
jgi:hypothetical protein